MKKIILTLFVATSFVVANARQATKDYLRPSLHMVVMTSDAEAASGTVQIADPEILGYATKSWDSYIIPAKYNDFDIPFKQIGVSAVKGSIIDILSMYSNPESLQGMGIQELKGIIEMLQGKKYREALKTEVEKVQGEVARELVKKWWGIQPDGSYSENLLVELSCMAATQNQAANAAETTLGAASSIFNELSDITMANTYVTFTKLDFYENEPVAAFVRNIMLVIASQTPAPANVGAELAASKTYEAMKEGYTAFANCLLYSLEWNSEYTDALFATIDNSSNKINMDKFNAIDFKLKFVGNTGSSVTCMMKKEDKGSGAEHMVNKTIYKVLDRQFADLNRAYEEFRPMVPIMGFDPKGGLIADMGTKEGIKVGDVFNILEPVTNEKGVTKYVSKGNVKVVKWAGDDFKDGVWNNAEIDNAQAAATADGSEDAVGTHLGKFKNATTSMFVKLSK